MNEGVILYSLILLCGVFVGSVSQVMLKKAALKKYDSPMKEYLNPLVITAYVLFVGTTLLSVLAYRVIPLSMGPVLESTSYIYVTFFGFYFFDERINRRKLISLAIIIGGILVYSFLG